MATAESRLSTSGVKPAPRHLLLLVGNNPMPNLQAVVTLKPEQVTIAHTKQTVKVATHLATAIRYLEQDIDVARVSIDHANRAPDVTHALAQLPKGWALSYTGGTKVMAAQARLLYETHGDGRPQYASIVDNVILTDDGATMPIAAHGIDTKLIARLHGHRLVGGRIPLPFEAVQQAKFDIENRLAAPVDPLRRLHHETRGELHKKLGEAGGMWFEEIAAAALAVNNDEVSLNNLLHLHTSDKDAPELDIVVRNGWSITVLSCTVSTERTPQKQKLMEAKERALDLGGGRARAGLVILNNNRRAQSLQNDVPAQAGLEHFIFTRNDITNWLKGIPAPHISAPQLA